jgi:hypothetical protein
MRKMKIRFKSLMWEKRAAEAGLRARVRHPLIKDAVKIAPILTIPQSL